MTPLKIYKNIDINGYISFIIMGITARLFKEAVKKPYLLVLGMVIGAMLYGGMKAIKKEKEGTLNKAMNIAVNTSIMYIFFVITEAVLSYV